MAVSPGMVSGRVVTLVSNVPGIQRTSLPSMRALRASTSWMVLLSTWPMCKTPVSFGGGITMAYAGFGEAGLATKSFLSNQNWYHFDSTDCGSYAFEISDIGF